MINKWKLRRRCAERVETDKIMPSAKADFWEMKCNFFITLSVLRTLEKKQISKITKAK